MTASISMLHYDKPHPGKLVERAMAASNFEWRYNGNSSAELLDAPTIEVKTICGVPNFVPQIVSYKQLH
jgi:hypothetical protein